MDEDMSEGMRALLEIITRNFGNESKFQDYPFSRNQDSLLGNSSNATNAAQLQWSSTLPSSSVPIKNDYAMAVKKTLEPSKISPSNVVYRQSLGSTPSVSMPPSPAPPLMKARQHQPTVQHQQSEPIRWKLDGRSVVNGINLSSLKFVKPARQCPKWDKPKHRVEEPNCPLWHPRVRCQYYPQCRLTAEVCGFGHPFCGEYCQCAPDKRSLQLNHLYRMDAVEIIRQKMQHG